MPEQYKVIVIGGGPIGLACALEAEKYNISCLVLEKGTLVNSIYNYPVNMTFFSTSERLEIGGVPFISNNPKPMRSEALEYYRRVTQEKRLKIHLFEKVVTVTGNSAGFLITTNKTFYTAENIVIATGFYDIPYVLNVPGEGLPKVKHYYDDPHFYAFQKVVVVGANNSAVDAALETWRKGATVTMVVRGANIGDRVKYWVRPDIVNRIKEGSIQCYFNSFIAEVRPLEIDIQTPEGLITIENDWVLAMTGYQPNLALLTSVGIELSEDEIKKPVYDTETHETNRKGIFLAGVVCGGMNTHSLFIENSREHAEKIMSHIKQKSPKKPFK